jgi:hypothetical protein
MRTTTATLVGLATMGFSLVASAQPPSPELMAKLAAQAAKFERMRTHASYAISGEMEQLDGDGHPSSVKQMLAHVLADGNEAQLFVDQYSEDGVDKTADAKKKEVERRSKRKEDAKKQIRIPTLAEEQPRYTFDIVEVDRADPTRVKLTFTPKEPDERTIEGSAWVDTRTGNAITAGFKFSKTSMFVDFVHVKVRFGADTPLGPAVSLVEFEGKGGILFLRKHFRGTARLSGYQVVP